MSGKQSLGFYGAVDLSSPSGEAGTLLLDPFNVVIQDAGPTGVAGTGTLADPFTSDSADDILSTSSINAALATATVKVITGDGGGGQPGNITIGGTITAPNNSNDLIFEAHNDIILTGTIDFSTNNSSGDIALRADFVNPDGTGQIIDGGGSILMGTGALQLSAGSGIGASGGGNAIEVQNLGDFAATTGTGGIFVNNTVSGNINITTVTIATDTNLANDVTVTGVTTTGASATDDIEITNNAGSITVTDAVSTASVSLDALSSGSVSLATADGDIVINNTVASGSNTAVASPTTGSITLTAGGNGAISGTGSLVVGAATSNDAVAGTAITGDISLTADKVSRTDGAAETDQFQISFGDASGGMANNDGTLSVITNGGLGTVGGVFIEATSGDIVLANGAINTGMGADVALTAAGAIRTSQGNDAVAEITGLASAYSVSLTADSIGIDAAGTDMRCFKSGAWAD